MVKISLLLFLFLSLSWADDVDITPTPTPVDAGRAQRAKEFLKRGNDFEARGYTAKAKEYWKIAFDIDPSLTEARENWEKASNRKSVSKASPEKSTRSFELLSKAQEAYDQKNYDLALKILNTVDSLTPDDPQAKRLREKITLFNFQFDPNQDSENLVKNFFDQAVELYQAKDYEKALKVLGQAEQMAPDQFQLKKLEAVIKDDYADIWARQEIQRAKDQWADGDKNDAVETIDDVLKQQPGCKEALKLQAQMNKTDDQTTKGDDQVELDKAKKDEAKNDFTDAKMHFEKALAIDPKDQVAQEGLKRVEGLIDPVEQKLEELKKAYKAGDRSAAQKALNEIANLSPDFPQLTSWKKKIERMTKKARVEFDPAKADECLHLGVDSYGKGDLDAAKKFWLEALEYNPQLVQAKTDLDRLLLHHNDLQQPTP